MMLILSSLQSFLKGSRLLLGAVLVVLGLSSLPAWAQTVGGACSGAGASAHGILSGGRYIDMVCDGMTWQERESNSTGSSSTAAKTLLQLGTDNGSCTAAKQGRITYNAETDTACYCSGSVWTKYGGTGTTCNDSAASNTVLLLKTNGVNAAANNTVLDSSANNFAVTRGGSISQGAFSPFSGAGGSLYIPSSAYLTVGYNSALNLGSNNFTIQTWVYFSSLPSTSGYSMITSYGQSTGNPRTLWYLDNRSSQSSPGLRFSIINASAGVDLDFSQGNMAGWSANTWYHIAIVRSGNNWTMYRNGTQLATTTSAAAMSTLTDNGFYVGKEPHVATGYLDGYISNLEVANTVRYPGAFTPPTIPLAPTANTILLLKGENAAIFDTTRNRNLETVSTAQVSTAQTKYSEAPSYFNGANVYLKTSDATSFSYPAGSAFTVEGWLYPVSVASDQTFFIIPITNGIQIGISNAGTGSKFGIAATLTAWRLLVPTNPTAGTWTHFAVVRDASNNCRIYFNGVLQASGTVSDSFVAGQAWIGGASGTSNAYIYDLRVTSSARYTANFTPPAGPLSNP